MEPEREPSKTWSGQSPGPRISTHWRLCPGSFSLAPPACSWCSWLSSEPGEQSLWSRLSMDHMMLLVSGCSISSKSRCSHGAGKHQQASRPPPPPLLSRAADCFCAGYKLPVSFAGLFVVRQPPLWITILPLWLWSCALSAPGPKSSGAQLGPPTATLSLVEAHCWLVEAVQTGSLGSLV